MFPRRQDRWKKLKPWLDIYKFRVFRKQRQESNLKVKFYGNSWFLRSIKFENCYKTESVSRDSNHAVCPFRDHLLHLRAMCSSTICSHSSPNRPFFFRPPLLWRPTNFANNSSPQTPPLFVPRPVYMAQSLTEPEDRRFCIYVRQPSMCFILRAVDFYFIIICCFPFSFVCVSRSLSWHFFFFWKMFAMYRSTMGCHCEQ